jgi:hypothetical protein
MGHLIMHDIPIFCNFWFWVHETRGEEPAGKDYSLQRLIVGMHTSENEPTYLMLAQVQMPLEDSKNDAQQYDD